MHPEPRTHYEPPEQTYHQGAFRIHPIFWVGLGLTLASIAGFAGYSLGRVTERGLIPRVVAEFPDGWRVYRFPDIGVQAELPQEPFRSYNLMDKAPARKGWQGRYYMSFGKGLEAEVYAQTQIGGWPSLHQRAEHVVEGFKRLDYGVSSVKYEPALVDGKHAEKITMHLNYHGDKMDYVGFCILDSDTEWNISARYFTDSDPRVKTGCKRMLDSIKIGSWGRLP